MEKHTGQGTPDESTLQKNWVEIIYNETLSKIRDIIESDIDGLYIANAIIGKFSSESFKPFLINSGELNKCSHQTIARFFNDTMGLLCP